MRLCYSRQSKGYYLKSINSGFSLYARLPSAIVTCVFTVDIHAMIISKPVALFSDPIITRSPMEEIIRLRNRVGR